MKRFPADFKWGVSTSAYQIEGAAYQDGKGPSVWDVFTEIPGKIHNGQGAAQSCDHYNRYLEDVKLMADMRLPYYRFSFSWPRILPQGKGQVNLLGLDFYDRLIDELLAHNIKPFATLYHWDLPVALQIEKDGWLNRDMAEIFADYAELCFDKFGDRIENWLTFNEPWVAAIMGYGFGNMAPGRKSKTETYLAAHHQLIAHGKTVQRFRSKGIGKIGMANNCDWREPYSEKPEDQAAAQRALEFFLGWFADPLYFGDYPKSMRERVGKDLPEFSAEESKLIKGSVDFFAVNHYTTLYVEHKNNAAPGSGIYDNTGFVEDQDLQTHADPDWKKMDMEGWHVVPWGIHKLLKWIDERYNRPEIIISENGCSFDVPVKNGEVNDHDRIEMLSGYLEACHQAIQEGVNLKGYFIWSLLDNFEWALGYSQKFGLHHIDPVSKNRIPKASAYWYKEVIARDGL